MVVVVVVMVVVVVYRIGLPNLAHRSRAVERAFPDLDLVCARGRAEEQPEGHSVSQDFDGLSTSHRDF